MALVSTEMKADQAAVASTNFAESPERSKEGNPTIDNLERYNWEGQTRVT